MQLQFIHIISSIYTSLSFIFFAIIHSIEAAAILTRFVCKTMFYKLDEFTKLHNTRVSNFYIIIESSLLSFSKFICGKC